MKLNKEEQFLKSEAQLKDKRTQVKKQDSKKLKYFLRSEETNCLSYNKFEILTIKETFKPFETCLNQHVQY